MLFTALLIACETGSLSRSFSDPNATRLELTSGNGVIEVVRGEQLLVEQSAEAGVGFAWQGETVDGLAQLSERCPLAWTCHVDTYVELPPGMALTLALGTGEVSLDGLEGDIRVDLDSATLQGVDLWAAHFELSAERANVDLELEGLADALVLDVAVGDLAVELPEGPYALDVQSGLGQVLIMNLEHAPDALVDLSLHTGAGDVSLTGTPAAEP